MYPFALAVALASCIAGHFRIGLKRLIHPIGYWRYPVFRMIAAFVKHSKPFRVLDIGSPKMLAVYLASRIQCDVFATDLQDSHIFIVWERHFNDYQQFIRRKNKISSYHTEYQDARKLNFPANHFDLVYSVSVLEHIPDDGDSLASAEIWRVLKPGGTAIIEVPFSKHSRNTFVHEQVYDRIFSGEPVFYQRHYDIQSIQTRIVKPSKLHLSSAHVIEERLPFETFFLNLYSIFQLPFLALSPLISLLNHKKIPLRHWNELNTNRHNARAIVLFLKK